MFKKDYFAHKTAIVEPGAEIGEGTKIWHYAVIREGAKIGRNCIICQHVFIDSDAIIGNNCKIKNSALIYSGVVLEDEVFIGPRVTTVNVKSPKAAIEKKHLFQRTLIKKGASIGAGSTVGCDLEIGEHAKIGQHTNVIHSVGHHVFFCGNPGKFKGYVNNNGDNCKFKDIQ